MSSFTDDLKQEMISDNPDMKVLFDWIDDRIDERAEQLITDRGYVSKEEVQEMIQRFNDR